MKKKSTIIYICMGAVIAVLTLTSVVAFLLVSHLNYELTHLRKLLDTEQKIRHDLLQRDKIFRRKSSILGFVREENRFVLKKNDLNTPVSPYEIYFQATPGSVEGQKVVFLTVSDEEYRVAHASPKREMWGKKPTPYSYHLYFEKCGNVTHTWWAQFEQDEGLSPYTLVELPEEDLRQLWLLVYFHDLGEDDARVAFHIDMSEYDWSEPLDIALPDKYFREPEESYIVRKEDLNKPVSPYDVYFYVTTSGFRRERTIKTIILQEERYYSEDPKRRQQQKEEQLVPEFYRWHLKDEEGETTHRWLQRFNYNIDHTYITGVSLPVEDLESSWLEVYFKDIDGEGKGISFFLDMTEYDWKGTSRRIKK